MATGPTATGRAAPQPDDRFVALIDELEAACDELAAGLASLKEAVALARSQHLAGVDFLAMFRSREGPAAREAVIAGLNRMHAALASTRAEAIRVMVDQEGMTKTDLARLLGHSRQLVSRLYREASDRARGKP